MSTTANADASALFTARSIALVGASTKENTLSFNMLRTMAAQLEGVALTAVNPRADVIAGVPCVRSLADLAEPADLVVVATPAATVPAVLDDAAERGSTAAIILSSGFAEIGAAGTHLQESIRESASKLAILGPNCQGMMYRPNGLVATFSPSIRDVVLPPPSPIGYVGQSGALGGAFADALRERGIALSAWVSTGNQVGVDVVDATSYLVADRKLDELFLYLEQSPPGQSWTALCRLAAETGCRLNVVRSGVSSSGRAAVQSHTGSLVGDDRAFLAVSKEYGVRFVDDIEDLVNRALAAAHGRRAGPTRKGGIAVLSSSGGAGALAADQAHANGVELARLSDDTRRRLAPLLPEFASTVNPIDVTAQLFTSGTAQLGDACQILAEDPDVSAIVVVLSLILDDGATRLARDVAAAASNVDVAVHLVYLASRDRTADARRIYGEAGVAVFDSLRAAMRALSSASDSHRTRGEGERVDSAGGLAIGGRPVTTVTPEHGGIELLDEIGIPQPSALRVDSPDEAVAATTKLGGHVVMKLGLAGVAHKSELSAVRLDVTPDTAAEVFDEFTAITSAVAGDDADSSRIYAYAMAPAGVEMLVNVQGAADGYGPTVTVGWGGTLVELHADVVTMTDERSGAEIRAALETLRCWPLLSGTRGESGTDVPALVAAIERIGSWARERGDLVEVEINPLRVLPAGGGVCALDVYAEFSSPI